MSALLEYLGKDSLPHDLEAEFVEWCVWQQARPALALILQKANLNRYAAEVKNVASLKSLSEVSRRAATEAHKLRGTTGPLALSSAEAAAFEVNHLARAATEHDWDPEGVAFFSARVCGWAGWAQTDYQQPARKVLAEDSARQQQGLHLHELWRKFGAAQG